MLALERAATDHSGRMKELEVWAQAKPEHLEGRSRRNNICLVGRPEGLEGPVRLGLLPND